MQLSKMIVEFKYTQNFTKCFYVYLVYLIIPYKSPLYNRCKLLGLMEARPRRSTPSLSVHSLGQSYGQLHEPMTCTDLHA